MSIFDFLELLQDPDFKDNASWALDSIVNNMIRIRACVELIAEKQGITDDQIKERADSFKRPGGDDHG